MMVVSTRLATGRRARSCIDFGRFINMMHTPSTVIQSKSDPSIPAHNPAILYMSGVVALLKLATYSSLKSFTISRCKRIKAADTTSSPETSRLRCAARKNRRSRRVKLTIPKISALPQDEREELAEFEKQITSLLASEKLEQKKSKIMLSVLKSQME